ncbi:MAG TPA: hypothetical protein VFC19_40105 [Candidatus Limnocylindrales bacterium]|nr:hypothetical protein [Candidatus Limnocylindrales bacterium]
MTRLKVRILALVLLAVALLFGGAGAHAATPLAEGIPIPADPPCTGGDGNCQFDWC